MTTVTKKIVYLAQGNSVHSLKWVNALSERGFEIHFISQDNFLSGLSASVRTHQLQHKGLMGYFLNVPTLKKLLREIKPDLLHSNYISGYGTLAALSGFSPHLMSVWGDDVVQFPKKSPLHKALIKFNLGRATAISATSAFLKKVTRPYTSKDITLIPFGVDTQKFSPAQQAKNKDKNKNTFTIGTAKYLQKQYGQETLIRAFHQFLQTLPAQEQNHCQLHIAGSGPDQTYYQELVQELHLQDQVRFLGYIPNDQIPVFLNTLDIFANLSFYESFGVAILEASACEIPVIGTRVGGIPEVIVEGQTGFLVEPNSVDTVASIFSQLKNDPALRHKLGQTGRQFVLDNYEQDKCVQTCLENYEKLFCS